MNKIVQPRLLVAFIFATFCWALPVTHSLAQAVNKAFNQAYLFVYFTGNTGNEEAIRFALSKDGYRFAALNGGGPVIGSAQISSTGGVRDPHIIRGADGKTFYMVATDMVSAKGWSSNRAMVLMKSTDLVHWSSSVVNIQNRFPGNDSLLRVWAPQTIYDPQVGKYMVYFSMKHGKDIDKIYYAYANADFTDLETVPKQLYFSADNSACIDGDIMEKNGKYYLFHKTEDRHPGIKIAVSDKLTEGYNLQGGYVQQTTDPVEGSCVFKLNDGSGYILMYDLYTKGRYQFTFTKDLQNFSVVDKEIYMNFHPRHGTVMSISNAEAERLVQQWLKPEDIKSTPQSPRIRKNNLFIDSLSGSLHLSLLPGTDVKQFDPGFLNFPGLEVLPKGPQDFSTGKTRYTIAVKGKALHTFYVEVDRHHNPVLNGFYADPEVLYAEQTGKFYIYPTSDGFTSWSGNYFKVFSSPDLVSWKDEGVIVDLPKDVSWAKTNAWAPCIIEKKINGQYKYFYYFTANKKIGVAVADSPVGPFKDAGSPIVDKFPEGITRGQQIDPDVFTDPATGKSYLYWGNAYLAGAELNDDMLSIKPETIKILTPDNTYCEGSYVFYRNGKYYFSWSQNDTRSPDYCVRYGIAAGPLEKIAVADTNNLIIAKNPSEGIYGTGHHSVLQLPGKDEWYIVYHRFNYPKGIKMGRAAGYNRETCIDKLEFNADGSIKKTVPTHEGIPTVKLR